MSGNVDNAQVNEFCVRGDHKSQVFIPAAKSITDIFTIKGWRRDREDTQDQSMEIGRYLYELRLKIRKFLCEVVIIHPIYCRTNMLRSHVALLILLQTGLK